MEDFTSKPFKDLVARFEKNIRFGSHSVRAEVSRSQAEKELRRRGSEALPFIETHMTALNASQDVDPLDERVLEAWGTLFEWMKVSS